MFNTVIGEEFGKWIDKQVEQRNARRKKELNTMVAMDPEIY